MIAIVQKTGLTEKDLNAFSKQSTLKAVNNEAKSKQNDDMIRAASGTSLGMISES